MTHFDDDQLSEYAFDPPAYARRGELEDHAQECADCASRLDVIRTIENGLRDQLPWKAAATLEHHPRPAALLRIADEILRERVEAETLLRPTMTSLLHFTRAETERDTRFQTTGAVYVLSAHAEARRESQPEFALALANSAVAIALKLADEQRLRSHAVLARAWTERSAALVLIGKFRDAENAARKAEAAAEAAPDATPHDSAVIWLLRSVICTETDRLDEAHLLASAAARYFAEFGDTTRHVKALLASANVLCMRRRFDEAVVDLECVTALARTLDDSLLLSRSLQSLGESYTALKQFDRAVPCFMETFALSEEIGAESEKLRAVWSLGNVLLLSGAYDEAIERLDEARRGFEALGVVNDTALVRLQLAEAMLAAERPSEVPAVLEGVTVAFASEDMLRNANLALAYLRESAANQTPDAEIVRHVRTYLEDLPADPTRRFMPLP